LTGLRYDGPGGDATLILGPQQLAGGLRVSATGVRVLAEDMTAAGPVEIAAPAITARGNLRGSSLSLNSPGLVTVEPAGSLASFAGTNGARIDVTAGTFVNTGRVQTGEPGSGLVRVHAGKVLQAGTLTAGGGNVRVEFTDSYIDTTAAVTSADGGATASGGQVTLDGGATGRLYSSGRLEATGSLGGRVDLFGREVVLAGTRVDASGQAGGGLIRVGGDFHGVDPAVANAQTVTVTGAATLRADALVRGAGGRVAVWSDRGTGFAGAVSARGGPGGRGGFIEVSAKGQLSYGGSADAGAVHGRAGTLLLDPKNLVVSAAPAGVFPQFDLIDPHPTAGGGFGTRVLVLNGGNVLVTNPNDDFGGTNAGAVYLFNGQTGALLSALVGGNPGDQVGSGSIVTLSNGNFLIDTPSWNGYRGAVTWASSAAGRSGTVSADNSLVGTDPGDQVGSLVSTLGGGNYLVRSPSWNGNRGAATWASGAAGVSGEVSAANSLVGTAPNDQVGSSLTTLGSGNYLVRSPAWNGQRGAVTWASGAAGVSGPVSEANSLVGSDLNDQVGSTLTTLSNGNYLVISPSWNGQRGAVTWASGTAGITGTVSEANSLVGSNPGDQVGTASNFVADLGNGNYVALSPNWNGQRGAATWGSGSSGARGAVSAANSLVGTNPGDQLGFAGRLLTNGNYLVLSLYWNGSRGAVTWGSGAAGVSGPVSATNSLVGTDPGDLVGRSSLVTPLSNGNYLVLTPAWNGSRGAATLGDGLTGTSGPVSAANSLVGTNPGDRVGGGLRLLANGNYLILSQSWGGGRGAVTWVSAADGVSGPVSAANSLVGTDPGDQLGSFGITTLSNGSYVVSTLSWKGNRGAATWGSGTTGVSGDVSEANSLVGSHPNDFVGSSLTTLSNGNYVVNSPSWNGSRGAVTWGSGTAGVSGPVSAANSLVGSDPGEQVGYAGVAPLGGGNYLVLSFLWNRGRGAATWGSGTAGVSGIVSEANSLVGTEPGDWVGYGLRTLSNGNYLVLSPYWNGNRGAVTWGSSAAGVSGPVSDANSLVGSNPGDRVGTDSRGSLRIIGLTNGNYLVPSASWNGSRGAVTWGSGATGVRGVVSEANSLVGGNPNDQVGWDIIALSNGNYVVRSPYWNGNRGAATWGSGVTGVSGIVSAANSLVGSDPGDTVSSASVTPLSTGDYLVVSQNWNGFRAAVTWVSGTTGQTLDGGGTITPQNSLLATTDYSNIGAFTEDRALQRFLVAWPTDGTGRVTAGFADPNQLRYAVGQGQTVTVTPDFLTRTLNTGTAVVLQASNDLTVNDPITVTANGQGGSLTLQAGRSILLNASISTDNGALALIANDSAANGVVDADRDPGSAVIATADGVILNTGTGVLTVELRDGAGLTNTDSGAITLQTVTAGSVSVTNHGPSAGSDVVLGSVTTAGPQTYANPNGTTVVTGNLVATDSPLTFTDAVLVNAGLTLNVGSSSVLFEGRATVAPGALTVSGGVALSSSATFGVTLEGTDPDSYSQVHASGPLDLGGSTLSLTLGFTPAVGDSFTLLSTDDSSPITGTFAGLDEGAVFSQNGMTFQITYRGGPRGNSVVLTRLT
jgi:hypothetical protein